MAYERTTASKALAVSAANCFRPSYLRTMARAAMDWKFVASAGPIRRVQLQSVLPEPQELRLSLSGHVWGEAPTQDMVAVCTLVKVHRPRAIFEFGTFTGHTTLNMAMNAPPDARLYTLDLPPGRRGGVDGLNWEREIDDSVIGGSYRRSPFADRVTQLYGDSRAFDPGPYAGQMDFVFVDACHEYEFVVNDSAKAFEMMSPDGVVAWHDYSRACPGVSRYLRELAERREVCVIEGTQVAFVRGRA